MAEHKQQNNKEENNMKNEELNYEKQKKMLIVGVTTEKEIVFIKIEIGSCDNNHYTITHSNYEGIITEEKGKAEAIERLSEKEYWKDCGMLQENFLSDFIDFEKVSNEVINNDGWQNINGEYEEIGEYEGETYFINSSSCGADAITSLKREYKKLLITEKERQVLIESDKLHLKDFKNYSKEEKAFFKSQILPLFNKINRGLIDAEGLIPLLKGV